MNDNQKYLANFINNGFVKIKNVLNKKEQKIYNLEVNKIFSYLKKKNYQRPYVNFTEDGKINTAHNLNKIFVKKLKITEFINNNKINLFLKNLLGPGFKIRNIEIFNKPAKTGMAAPIHQDNFYWNVKNKKALNLWLSFNHVSKKNGGVFYFRGSHKIGLLNHINSYEKGSSKKISDKQLKKVLGKYKIYTPSLNPGDLLIHHCEVVHGSNRNNSDIDRRAIVISLISKDATYDKKRINKYLRSLKKQIKIN